MKKYIISIFAITSFLFASCGLNETEVQFGVVTESEGDALTIGSAGGVLKFEVSSPGDWVVITPEPWMSVSPANGNGSAVCEIQVDSALFSQPRTGSIRIQSMYDDKLKSDITVTQSGFPYSIVLEDQTVKIDDFAELESRSFDVVVKSNVRFDVVLPEGADKWLSYTQGPLDLGDSSDPAKVLRRPRNSVVRFNWSVNTRDTERIADIMFKPSALESDTQLERQDGLKVVQKAALPIPANTPQGDSLALIAISRALGIFTPWDTSENMEHWNNVKVWKDGPNKGRVRYVQFFMFKTKEPIPYEIQYLTAAEEIVIYSNANHFLLSMDTGEYITKLTGLKRLTIGAYGLTSLHPDFVNLKNLEYLDLSSNCFQEIPEILTPENFPNLHALVMNANQRHTIYDLSNDTRENIGGFIDDDLNTAKGQKAIKRLLKWSQLDTIRLSVNYLQGELPDMMDEGLPVWTFEELKDSLATGLTELPESLRDVPKVLPDTKFFAINFNRLTGNVPQWLLMHPKLDIWAPYSLVFSQEGKTKDGSNAGFANEPVSLDYYYDIYKNKKYNPNNSTVE